MSIDDLKKFIREELGRNLHTVNAGPITFEDLPGYDVQIDGFVGNGFNLTVFYYEEKIFPTTRFNNHEEAVSFSRQVIDKDRVKRMNK